MARKITAIAPHKSFEFQRKKVAAYARVSSGKDAMLHSLSAQVSYYSKMIQSRPDWQYVGVYADEAATGTKDNRNEFQRMISDCKAGNIDMIITKSISRFARNTVTLLETVRELKELNVDVYFEEQNIHSMSGDGELMLTILASFAQEESLSVSENCKWRIRNEFKRGIPTICEMFGYDTSGRKFKIIEEEAETVRKIFEYYLDGYGKQKIANMLNEAGFKTKHDNLWDVKKIDLILHNEKYAGDLLMQKGFKNNHLEKKNIKNTGQLPKYLVTNNHEPIVDRETFEKVQILLAKRSKTVPEEHIPGQPYMFTGKIQCGICGKNYMHKRNSCGTKYENEVWICPTYNKRGKKYCPSKMIPNNILESVVKKYDKKFERIYAYPENRLKIVFEDGNVKETVWHDKSRKWTDEMKRKNYDNLRKRHKS